MLWEVFTWSLLAFVGWFILRFAILFGLKMYHYKKQGLPMDAFFPVFGLPAYTAQVDVKKHHDPTYSFCQSVKENPDKKFFVSSLLDYPYLYIVDPNVAKEYITDKRPKFYTKKHPFFKLGEMYANGGLGLAAVEGDLWKKHRKVISELFHFEFIKSMIPGIQQIIDYRFDLIKKKNEPVDALKEYQMITGSVMGALFMGIPKEQSELTTLISKLNQLLITLFKQRESILVLIFGPHIIKLGLTEDHRRLLEHQKWAIDYMTSLINARRVLIKENKGKPTDEKRFRGMIELLLEKNETCEEADRFTDKEIIGEFFAFVIAGMDTSSHLLTWFTHYMLKYPEIKKKIQEEIKTVFGGEGRQIIPQITKEKLDSCEYYQTFLKEALRFIPVAPQLLMMQATADHELGGVTISKGTIMSISIAALGKHPKYYDKVDEFRPERWSNPEEKKKIDTFADIPFSSGPRNCIGQHLARLQAHMVLVTLLQTFDFTNADPNFKDNHLTQRFLIEFEKPLTLNMKPKAQ